MAEANPLNAVRQSIKTAVAGIDKDIRALEAQKAKLLKAIEAPATPKATVDSTPATKTKAKAAGASKGTRGPGMLNVVLPFMEGKASVKSADMIAYLQANGYPNMKPNSFYATVANELKRPKSRIEKIGDGEYRVSAAYFELPARPEVAEPAAAEAPAEVAQ